MITEIYIKDNLRSPKNYLSGISAFKDGTRYIFKPGVNIVIGRNGCGKSTLIDLISEYTLCTRGMKSSLPGGSLLSLDSLFSRSDKLLGGVEIKADYLGVVFRYLPKQDISGETSLENIDNFALVTSSASTGEGTMEGLAALFRRMFSEDTDILFPYRRLAEISETVNDVWSGRIKSLLEYYKNNRIKVTEDSFRYTILMDEPDRNLDVNNLKEVYGILASDKPRTQIIAVIHNPLLIYKLSSCGNVNIIEMTPGYLQEIKDFVNGDL